MDGVDYSNFMMAFRGMARDIEKIVKRLDKLIEMQGAVTVLPATMEVAGEGLQCPVCGGDGVVPNTDPGSTSTIMSCKNCGGKGWN